MHPLEEGTAIKLVALYHDVLAAMLDTPETFLDTLCRKVSLTIACHGFVMVVEPDIYAVPEEGRTEDVAHVQLDLQTRNMPSEIRVRSVEIRQGRDILEDLIADAGEDLTATINARFPDNKGLHVHWIRSDRPPRVAAAIFRVSGKEKYGDYTPRERDQLESMTPHLLNCIRIYQELTRTRRAAYDFFSERCVALAAASGLTSTEERVLRKMVEGATNKVISEELGTSLATVKTHISHILQKTGCRNRTDLIGKHFSSKHAVIAT